MMAALSFLLPCETNEKVGLEITVLLSLAVMQLVILGMIPASSETLPLIGPLIRHQGYVNYGGGRGWGWGRVCVCVGGGGGGGAFRTREAFDSDFVWAQDSVVVFLFFFLLFFFLLSSCFFVCVFVCVFLLCFYLCFSFFSCFLFCFV